MFNPLSPQEVVMAVGATSRHIARSQDPGSEFARTQLMSAYSACRHIAVEIECFGPEIESMMHDVAGYVKDSTLDIKFKSKKSTFVGGIGVIAAAEIICNVLAELRERANPESRILRGKIQKRLAQLMDKEVLLLAEAIEKRK